VKVSSPSQRIERLVARGIVALAGLTLLAPGLGNRVLTYHEVCFAQPAREMLASGRWVVPEIAGVIFPDKPPLAHWTAAASMAVFGENAFAVRLPFALAGVALAAVVAEVGFLFWGPLVGVLAGLVQLTCYYTLLQSRLAECDILLTLAVAIGLTTFTFVEFGGKAFSWRSAVVCHGCLAAAFLAKGPIGVVFLGAPILAFLVIERRWDSCKKWLHLAGLLVSLAAIVGWIAAAVWTHPEIVEGWKRHNLDRFSGTLEGEETWPVYYLGMIPLLLLPWTPWVALGWWRSRLEVRPEIVRLRRLTLCWILPGLLVISTASWRHKHYAIPLLPMLSVWGAVGLVAWMRDVPKTRIIPVLLLAATAFIAGTSLLGRSPANMDALWPLVVLIPTATAVVALLRWQGRRRLALGALIAAVGATSSWSLNQVVPRFDSYADQTAFARRVADKTGGDRLFVPFIATKPGVPLALPENQIAFYLPLTLRVLPKSTTPEHDVEWVLAPERIGEALHGFETVDRCDRLRGLMKPGDQLTLFRRVPQTARRDESRSAVVR
jgi:4-amino-4-deoxy-L-arabinose transferase-like glycosyltransferase